MSDKLDDLRAMLNAAIDDLATAKAQLEEASAEVDIARTKHTAATNAAIRARRAYDSAREALDRHIKEGTPT